MRLSLLPHITTWSPRDVRSIYVYRQQTVYSSPGADDFLMEFYPAPTGKWTLLYRMEIRLRRTGGTSSSALYQVYLGASYFDGMLYDYRLDATPLNSWVVVGVPIYVAIFPGDYISMEVYFDSLFIGVIQPYLYGNIYDL